MTEDEIKRARTLYEQDQMTLSQVRETMVDEGYPSRSVNTIAMRLREDGCEMRRPGRQARTIGA